MREGGEEGEESGGRGDLVGEGRGEGGRDFCRGWKQRVIISV